MFLEIDEEYGYGRWVAEFTDEEYKEFLRKWETMRGINCLVPIPFLIPQAKRLKWTDTAPQGARHCHVHECDDSWIEDSSCKIPETDDQSFWWDGKQYSYDDVIEILSKFRESEARLNNG